MSTLLSSFCGWFPCMKETNNCNKNLQDIIMIYGLRCSVKRHIFSTTISCKQGLHCITEADSWRGHSVCRAALSRSVAARPFCALTCVRPDVSLEQPRSGESFAAYLTNTRQRVSPDVHFERSEAHVLLLAVFTTEGFPRLGVAVQLLVLEQSGVRGVGLVTQTTLELLRLHAVWIRQLGQHLLILVAPRALGAAVVLGGGVGQGGRVSGDGGEVTGQRGQR